MIAPVESPQGYLQMQAQVGITKHLGGFAATNALLERCRVATAHEVLYIGSGIGVGPAYIARRYGCRVVAIDIAPQMIAWSRQRAREERVAGRVDLAVADLLALPFAADRFDAVLCESVLGFVEDKPAAIAACARVVRPGGYVGLNETLWIDPPPPDVRARVHALGVDVPTAEDWCGLWAASGLRDQVVTLHRIDARDEIRDRIAWVGWRWALRAWGRVLWSAIRSPASARAYAALATASVDATPCMGYGLFVGRK